MITNHHHDHQSSACLKVHYHQYKQLYLSNYLSVSYHVQYSILIFAAHNANRIGFAKLEDAREVEPVDERK